MLHGLQCITLLRHLKACLLPRKLCDEEAGLIGCVWAADGITLGLAERAGMFRLAQYGPINSLSIRKNEVILTVQL